MKDIYSIIRKGVVTEKSAAAKEGLHKFTFVVDPRANKIEIRQAIERIFGLKNKVLSVRTSNFAGKYKSKGRKGGYKPDWKKAVVTLAKGTNIKEFEEG
jgi:large subunit ribosomal protein L23